MAEAAARPEKKAGFHRATVGDYVIALILTLVALMIFLPFYNTVVVSFETPRA